MKISILYVNYRTPDLTVRSIDSVMRLCAAKDYDITVVDNASGDTIAEALKPYPEVQLIRLPDNIGFGRANNQGVKATTGEYLFFLNTDTQLLNNAPERMADYLDSHPDTGAVGANLFHDDGTPNQSFMYCATLWSEIRALLPNGIKRNHYAPSRWFNFTDRPKEVGYISGAAVMIRRDWAEKHGAFDPDFFMYYEDMELSDRVRQSGLRVMNLPTARIVHWGGGSSSTQSVDRHRLLCNTKYTYYRKTHSAAYAKAVYHTTQTLYWIYATFAGRAKRTLFRQYRIDNRYQWTKAHRQ